MKFARLLVPLLIVLASVAAFAQSQDGQAVSPTPIVVFSNLGPVGDVYYDVKGWDVTGPKGPSQDKQWVAMSFTPEANVSVTSLQLAIGYRLSGENGVVVQLASDAEGLPGTPLHTWGAQNLPTFGTCCQLVTIEVSPGIPLTAGIQYWVVARTNSKTVFTYDGWAWNWQQAQGTFAFFLGLNGGWKLSLGAIPAFAVYGIQ